MDYVTLNTQNHRLYVPRSTHTMVIDAESGKTVADIPGQKHNHGVALTPDGGLSVTETEQSSFSISRRMPSSEPSKLVPMLMASFSIKANGLVLVVSGDDGVLMTFKPDVDPKTGSIDAPRRPKSSFGSMPQRMAVGAPHRIAPNQLAKTVLPPHEKNLKVFERGNSQFFI